MMAKPLEFLITYDFAEHHCELNPSKLCHFQLSIPSDEILHKQHGSLQLLHNCQLHTVETVFLSNELDWTMLSALVARR